MRFAEHQFPEAFSFLPSPQSDFSKPKLSGAAPAQCVLPLQSNNRIDRIGLWLEKLEGVPTNFIGDSHVWLLWIGFVE
jgi:hypothetical protein